MKKILVILVFLVLVSGINALDQTRQYRLEFGHILDVNEIGTDPMTLSPGKSSILNILIENTGKEFVKDLRVQLEPPDEVAFLNDVSNKKTAQLDSGESKMIEFNIIALPDAEEGIYEALLQFDYVNHIGEERHDNYTISFIVKGSPKMFVKISDSEVYKENKIGDVTITFVNNDVANLKFLTVELMESEDYEIISSNREYIGDLDSDDFESVDFRISVNDKAGDVMLPLTVSYKDSLNEDYSENFTALLKMRSAKELGISEGSSWTWIILLIIILIAGYFGYRKFFIKKKRT
jgi:hypothetical protein